MAEAARTIPTRVGIIGLSARGGWAATAHLPALRSLPGFEVRGLTASSPSAGLAAAGAHAVPRVFATPDDLITDDEIDVVVVAVKVTDHRELVLRAIAAGKAVVCEWPLGRSLTEARELADAAHRAGVKALIGLQARNAPAVLRLRDLVSKDGPLGAVLSTSVHGGGGNQVGSFATRSVYQLDRANGATLITIPLAHTLDALTSALGPISELSATTAVRRVSLVNQETGGSATTTAEDEVALNGRLASGGVVSVHLHRGVPERDGFVWRIHGSRADLTITQDWAHPQFGALTIHQDHVATHQEDNAIHQHDLADSAPPWITVQTPSSASLTRLGPSDAGYNVAHAYQRFHTWLHGGPRSTPDFQDAVAHHELIEAVHRAAETGHRQVLTT